MAKKEAPKEEKGGKGRLKKTVAAHHGSGHKKRGGKGKKNC
jgi:hypothetical protein